MGSVASAWQKTFMGVVCSHETAEPLRVAALGAKLGPWTKALTKSVAAACDEMGWNVSARDHRFENTPVPRSEYLALDVMAFPRRDSRWQFPVAVMELENSPNDDRIAYSLWKVMCIRAALRVVFCYRRDADQGAPLVRQLEEQVVKAMDRGALTSLSGDTMLVVGSRGESETFPYGFFRWWLLETNTAKFGIL